MRELRRDLRGKVILLTGATNGIGEFAARELAARGASLGIVARDRSKGERLLADLRHANDAVELYVADLSRQADVRALAGEFRARHDRLDVLANNAGALFQAYRLSADGYEMTFALNHLAYFLLTVLLLDLVEKTPGARIVNTSSSVHASARFVLDDLPRRERSRRAGFAAYCDSKLANVLFTRQLAKRLRPGGATVCCFHPGLVHTGFALGEETVVSSVLRLLRPLVARTPAQGARTLLWLATSEAQPANGEYFFDCMVARTSRAARDDALAERLWALSESLCTHP